MKRAVLIVSIFLFSFNFYAMPKEDFRIGIRQITSISKDETSPIPVHPKDSFAIATGFKSILHINGDFRGFAPTALNSSVSSADGDTIQVICGKANGGEGTGFLGVYYTVSFDAGATWSIPELITSAGPFTRNYNEIAVADGQYPYVIVNYSTANYRGDWFTTDPLGPGQGAWTPPILITDTANYAAYMPTIAVNNAGDKVTVIAYDATGGIGSNYSTDYGMTWHTYNLPTSLNDSIWGPDVCAARWGSGDDVHAIIGMSWYDEMRYDIAGASAAFFEGYSMSTNGGQTWSVVKGLYNGDGRPAIPSINGDTFTYYIDNLPGNGVANYSPVKAYLDQGTGYWADSKGDIDNGYYGFGTWWYWWDEEYYEESHTLFYAIPMADLFVDYYVQPGGDLYTFPWQGQSIIFGFKRDADAEFTYDYIDVHDSIILNTSGNSATWRGNLFSANISYDVSDGTVYIIYQDYVDTAVGEACIEALRINNNEIYRATLVLNTASYTTEVASYITDDGYAHITICPGVIDSIYYKSVDVKDPLLLWTYIGTSSYSYNPSDTIDPTAFNLISPSGNITDNTPTYLWHSSYDEHFKNYQLNVNGTLKATLTDTTWTQPTSIADGQYIWYVTAYDSFSNSKQSTKRDTFRIDLTKPSIPSLVSPSNNAYTTSNTFVWRKATDNFSGVKNYEIWYDDDSLFGSHSSQETTDTTYTAILINQRYFWKVRAKDNFDNVGDWSARRTFVYDIVASSAFSLISPDSNITDNTPTFIWHKSNDLFFRYYRLYINGSLKTTLIDTTYTDGAAFNDGEYAWFVEASDSAGNTTNSTQTDTFGIDMTKPDAPVLVNPLNNSCSNVNTFIWNRATDNFSGVKNYEIWYDDDSLFGSPSVQMPADTTCTAILSEQIYFWRVRAIDNCDNIGNWSTRWSFEYDSTIPAVPILANPIGDAEIGDSTVFFDWSAVAKTKTTTFADENSDDRTINATQINYIIQIDTSTAFISPYYTDGILEDSITLKITAGGKYYWRVKAYDEAGNQGSWTNADSFRLDAKGPSTPILVSPLDNTSSATGIFVWNASADDYSGVKEYTLWYDEDSMFASSETITVTDTTHTAVLSDYVYYWKVKATDNYDNMGDWSAVWSFDYSPVGITDKFILDTEERCKTELSVSMNEIRYTTVTTDNKLMIYDIAGKQIFSAIESRIGQHKYSTSKLSSGIYFVKFRDAEKEINKKLVIIK